MARGSQRMISSPVASNSHRAPVSHGPNRSCVCSKVRSAPATPRTRRVIISTQASTTPMPAMWMDCVTGMNQASFF